MALLPPTNQTFNIASPSNNYYAALPFQKTTDSLDAKIDDNLSDKDRLTGRFSFSRPVVFQAPLFGMAGGDGPGTAFVGTGTQKTYSSNVNYDRVISHTMMVEARLAVSHYHNEAQPSDYGNRHGFAHSAQQPGNTLAHTGRLQEAIAEYQTALRLKPDYAEARASLAAALEAGPDSAERHYNLGVSISQQGRAAEAVAEFEAALRLKPDYADAENNLGVTLTRMPQRSGEAIAHFQAALRLRPDYADAHYNLGIALANTPGGMPEALRHFEAALKLRPDPELRKLVDQLRRER
jgi:tetratricopeptide (TPR) repeat protein